MTTRKVRKPRIIHDSKLSTPTARLLLAVRRKPYNGPSLARGVKLQYRRNKGVGSWVLKVANGHGRYWTDAFAEADDFDPANGKTILDFFEAQDVAKKLVGRGDVADDAAAPITVEGALKAYRADLIARNSNPYNADWPRVHLTSALLAKPVALLNSRELKTWRNSLLGTMAPSTINRLGRCLCAALEQAAQHDKRIQNRDAWEVGLALLPNAFVARNIVLPDDTVRAFVATAYGLDHQFGLLSDTLATTGARPSQAVRLRVEDLHEQDTGATKSRHVRHTTHGNERSRRRPSTMPHGSVNSNSVRGSRPPPDAPPPAIPPPQAPRPARAATAGAAALSTEQERSCCDCPREGR